MSTTTECELAKASELDLKKTFECGQCFRWNADAAGVYTGVSDGRLLRLRRKGELIVSVGSFDEAYWRGYFDLGVNYAAASRLFTEPAYLRQCAEFGAGIRILRQEPWEALCSFIISQCNNIPRIKKIVETLCESFGDELEDSVFTFPRAEVVAGLSVSELSVLRSGYRAQYILDAARAVAEGRLDFDELKKADAGEVFKRLKQLNGVGDKVANCFMLYGLHRCERFPVDVWMKRALKAHFPENYDPTVLGDFAGLAQQYIFYYARSGEPHSEG